ncbi:MAG: hypothetical protein ThorAB25_25820 [Candidatus Thorarchaeota archaeon AB_25]|nr:MAG: hypothetical protein ThorAB25_25820 [Candidatus Thorarchaeota archaeon AB_25]
MELDKKTKEPKYQGLFIAGMCFIGAGSIFVTTGMIPFICLVGMGFCFMGIGFVNRHKWKR